MLSGLIICKVIAETFCRSAQQFLLIIKDEMGAGWGGGGVDNKMFPYRES